MSYIANSCTWEAPAWDLLEKRERESRTMMQDLTLQPENITYHRGQIYYTQNLHSAFKLEISHAAQLLQKNCFRA